MTSRVGGGSIVSCLRHRMGSQLSSFQTLPEILDKAFFLIASDHHIVMKYPEAFFLLLGIIAGVEQIHTPSLKYIL